MKNNNMFYITTFVVASSGTYHGTGISRSPKTAARMADAAMWKALSAGDRAKGMCSGLAVDGITSRKYGKILSQTVHW